VGSRRFSFSDFIWIQLVDELRSFGVSLPVIKQIASEIYEPLPLKELFATLSKNLELIQVEHNDSEKEEFHERIKSGQYKETDFSVYKFNYLHLLIAEAIQTRSPVSLLIFKDGTWLPFMKEKENAYPVEFLQKKEYSSYIRVSITETVFSHILEDYLIEYTEWLHLFTKQEEKLLQYIKAGDYKKVKVVFKSKKQEPIEIKKDKDSQEEILRILRDKKYREFILTDKKGMNHRIQESQDEMLAKALNK
ncbi:MAG: hypothetical protein ACHQRM_18155, partial [Bacteroidia bacterium]